TSSSDFPVTAGAFQTTFPGDPESGGQAAFVTKFSADGTTLVYSSYLGGSAGASTGYGIAVDGQQNVYVTGATAASNFLISSAAHHSSVSGTAAFLSKVKYDFTTLTYSTFLGGSGTDTGYAVAVDRNGLANVTGSTASSNFPTVSGAYQTALSG